MPPLETQQRHSGAPPSSVPVRPETVPGPRLFAVVVAAVALSVVAALLVADGGTTVVEQPASSADGDVGGDTGAGAAAAPRTADRVAADPAAVGTPVGARGPQVVDLELTTTEIEGQLADGTTYSYWTFDNQVPGPVLRVRVGDTVNLTLHNSADSTNIHSIDLHAVTGPGGGAAALQVPPGASKSITFEARNAGVFVYHCATPHIPTHIANGMYGLIIVEPEGGLPPVDREFAVMQGEIYAQEGLGAQGLVTYDADAMLSEDPSYVVFNGQANALTGDHAMQAEVGETVRLFVGNGGPNLISSFHVIGEIFDRVHPEGATEALHNVQTTLVPAGGATWVEFTIEVPGDYLLVDHAITRTIDRGALAILHASGDDNPSVFEAHDLEEPAAAEEPAVDEEPGAAAGDVVEVSMTEFAFAPGTLSLPAGEHTFRVVNDGVAPHQFAIGPVGVHDGHVADSGEVAAGEGYEVTLDLEPGVYEIACHIPGHYEAGMKTTLEVT